MVRANQARFIIHRTQPSASLSTAVASLQSRLQNCFYPLPTDDIEQHQCGAGRALCVTFKLRDVAGGQVQIVRENGLTEMGFSRRAFISLPVIVTVTAGATPACRIVIFSWATFVRMPLPCMSRAVSSSSRVSRLVFGFFVFVTILHLEVPSFRACAIVLSSAFKNDATISRRVINSALSMFSNSALSMFSRSFLAKAKRKIGSIGTNPDQHTEATSPALPRPCDPLLDDLTTKVSINKPSYCPLDCIHKAVITDTLLSRKLRKCFGFKVRTIIYRSTNYSF